MIEERILDIFANAKRVAVLTGAGVSAESGVATFRDKDGLWTKFNPQELASMNGFMSNPDLVWEWYNYRRKIVSEVKPNAGHYALAEMQKLYSDFAVITQNVDRLHQKAGSQNVVELHGNIIENYCKDCYTPFEGDPISEEKVPHCKKCNGLIRPAVVWFGEMLPADAIELADIKSRNCDLFLSIGTSGEVYPAAGLPSIAQAEGAFTIEINPTETVQTRYFDYSFLSKSGEILPIILEEIKKRRNK